MGKGAIKTVLLAGIKGDRTHKESIKKRNVKFNCIKDIIQF